MHLSFRKTAWGDREIVLTACLFETFYQMVLSTLSSTQIPDISFSYKLLGLYGQIAHINEGFTIL